jgi:hypothetical protein
MSQTAYGDFLQNFLMPAQASGQSGQVGASSYID